MEIVQTLRDDMYEQAESTAQEVNESELSTPNAVSTSSGREEGSIQVAGLAQTAAASSPPEQPPTEGVLTTELPFDQAAPGACHASLETDQFRQVTIRVGARSPMAKRVERPEVPSFRLRFVAERSNHVYGGETDA
jgi:hypothetical protein